MAEAHQEPDNSTHLEVDHSLTFRRPLTQQALLITDADWIFQPFDPFSASPLRLNPSQAEGLEYPAPLVIRAQA